MFALAMSAASGLWGGYGFIYLPRGTQGLHPALARILSAYDPDYLVDAGWTHGDVEAMEPGWHARRYKGWPAGPEESAARLAQILGEEMVHGDLGDDVGSNRCSPFYEHDDERRMQVLSEHSDGQGVHRLATVMGGTPQADFEVPDGLDPLLMLALGMRAGYPAKPRLPLGSDAGGAAEHLPRRYVRYVLSIRQDRVGRELGALTTAWGLTQTGLVQIGKARPLARPVAVIGSTAEDFALAVALDRMYGAVTWVPAEWTQDPDLRRPLDEGFRGLQNAARSWGQRPVVTTISLSQDALRAAVQSSWPGLVLGSWGDSGTVQTYGGEPPEIVAAEDLDLQSPMHLACAGDFDLSFPSPTRADGRGGFEFLLPVPVYTPRSGELRAAQRPFWEVDVEAYPQRMPAGRNLHSRTVLAGEEAHPSTVARSGRDGISFNAVNMFYVPGGATLEQSVTRPRLRVPGLRGWIESLAVQDHPNSTVELSQAGRRAMILTRLWGSRSAVARDVLALNDFLREFKASGSGDTEAYPEGDGVRLTSGEGYLTFAAAVRTLRGMNQGEVREQLDRLLHVNVVKRGLIVRCSECERRAFYGIDRVQETNTCPRCGAAAHATAAWRTGNAEDGEPCWFYDLHGAVREFLEQDGDVPFLAGRAFAATARTFEDIAELDFRWPGEEKPDEIDIAALVDGRVVIGEAKRIATLGTRRDSNHAIQKLIRVSDLVGADEVVLATTAAAPWDERDTRQLLKATGGHRWKFGTAPRIRVMTDLRGDPQISLLN
jgi:hypothetical protein